MLQQRRHPWVDAGVGEEMRQPVAIMLERKVRWSMWMEIKVTTNRWEWTV
jgi:hypothetical protein